MLLLPHVQPPSDLGQLCGQLTRAAVLLPVAISAPSDTVPTSAP